MGLLGCLVVHVVAVVPLPLPRAGARLNSCLPRALGRGWGDRPAAVVTGAALGGTAGSGRTAQLVQGSLHRATQWP